MVMQENTKGLYAAFKAKDVRFDGRFSWAYRLRESIAVRSAGPGSQRPKIALFQDGCRCGTSRLQTLPFMQA